MPLLAPGIGPLGLPELVIIAFIVILIFGVGRLPEVGGAVGKSIKEFRKSTKDDGGDDDAPVAQSAEPAAVGAAAGATAGATAVTSAPSPAAPAPTPAPAASVTADAETRFCSECGAKNIRSAKFCAECGNSMTAAAR